MGKSKIIVIAIFLPLVMLALLNLLVVFTPELGFDALWYHLTLPKLWLLKHQWYFPGGLLYYSAMPRLAETIFIPLVQLTGSIGPKFVQYLSGIGTAIVIWRIGKNIKLPPIGRAVAVSLFYATFLVSWQSGSAYIDLIRTFLESLALLYLLKGNWKTGGFFLGLAIGTKWLALGSLTIYAAVFGPQIIFPALLISLPWFALSYWFTGNPIYPIFSGIVSNSFTGLVESLRHVLLAPYFLTRPFDDFMSPLIGVLFLLSLPALRSENRQIRRLAMIGIVGSLFSLVIDPPSSRYFLPFLPAVALTAVAFIYSLHSSRLEKLLLVGALGSSVLILGLRIAATTKYLPYLTGRLNENEFLSANYSRLPGTFVDSDGYVRSLPVGSRILVDRLHNLYYFPRDFDHTSWVGDISGYDYLVTVGESGGDVRGELVHTNNLGIQVFKLTK